jgi:glucose/mannose-6-phosphate isomerase
MRNIIFNLPEQLKDASQIPIKLKRGKAAKYTNIVVCGMGGSGIGGDILKVLLSPRLVIPVLTVKNYRLPAFVTKTSLLFAVSYSGNTEETLEAFADAQKIGCRVIAITSDGKLLNNCEKNPTEYVEIPQGLSPRCAIGYLFIPLLLCLSKLGILKNVNKDIQETITTLYTNRKKYENFAKTFAKDLKGKLPMIYAVSPLFAPVAERWQKQFNENAEIIAHSNIFPELDHNEIMGIANTDQLVPLYFLFLLDPKAHPKNLRRVDFTLDIMKQNYRVQHKPVIFKYKKFLPDGKSDLARIFSLIMLGDLISLYLARARDVAPELISAIDELKKKIDNKKIRKNYN